MDLRVFPIVQVVGKEDQMVIINLALGVIRKDSDIAISGIR